MFRKGKLVLSGALFILAFAPLLSAQDLSPLPPTGEVVEKELRPTEKHRYRYEASTNQYVHLVVMQKGIDLAVRLLTADNSKIAEFDSPNGANGPEPVWFLFEKGRTYIVEVTSLEPDSVTGKYELKVENLREATPDDRHFVSATTIIRDTSQLGNPADPSVREQVMARCRSAIMEVEKIVDHLRRADGYVLAAQLIGATGERVIAVDYFDKAIKIYRDSNATRKLLGAMKSAQTFSPSTIDALKRTDGIRSLAASIGDRRTEGYAYREISVNYYSLGDLQRAVESAKKSVEIATEIADSDLLESNYDNLGSFYTAQHNFAGALESHLKSLAIQTEGGGRANAGTLLNIGNVYAGLGNHPLAIRSYEDANTEFERRQSLGMFVAMSNIGSSYIGLGEYDKALEYLLKMKARFVPDDPIGVNVLATACYKIAAAYQAKGQLTKALEYVDEAVELTRKTGDNHQLAYAYVVRSNTYWEMHNFPDALKDATAAIDLAKEFGYEDVTWSAKMSAAKALLGLKSRGDARRLLEESVAVIDDLRGKFTGPEENIGMFFEATDAPLKLLIEIEVEDKRNSEGFRFAEKIKAHSLLDVLANGKINVTKAMTGEEIKTESTFKNELASLNAQVKDADTEKAKQVEAELAKKRSEYDEFRTRLYGTHPELRFRRGEFPLVDIEDTKSLQLRPETAIAEFVVSNDSVILFFLEGRSSAAPKLTAFKIQTTKADLEASIERFRSNLAKGDPGYRSSARALYDRLLGPLEVQLKGKTDIVIVPDGPLWDLPFQVLMDEKGKYLIEKTAVSYTPSLTAFREMQKKGESTRAKRKAGAELLAFGNPIIGGDTVQRVQRVFMSEKLEPLPEAERLVQELGKMYGENRSKVYIGAAARETVVKSEAPKYRIVQFATHGVLNDISPMYSHLVFAKDEKDRNEDGLLEAWELKDLDLNADMVVLSACDTARGKVSSGEGVIGMTWAVFIAGAPTTVASQWKVESSSTTELMLEFHRQLLSNPRISKAEALRRAATKLLRSRNYRHPYYWAGFVLIGDGS